MGGEQVAGFGEHIPGAIFSRVPNPGGKAPINPGTTMEFVAGNGFGGGKLLDKFGDRDEFELAIGAQFFVEGS